MLTITIFRCRIWKYPHAFKSIENPFTFQQLTLKEKSSDRSCVSKLKTRIFWVVGSSPLEVAPSPWQTGGLHFKLDCSCNWLLLLAKNEAENQPLGNFSGFLFKVLNNTQYQYQFFERRLAIPNTNILKVLSNTNIYKTPQYYPISQKLLFLCL